MTSSLANQYILCVSVSRLSYLIYTVNSVMLNSQPKALNPVREHSLSNTCIFSVKYIMAFLQVSNTKQHFIQYYAQERFSSAKSTKRKKCENMTLNKPQNDACLQHKS